MEELRQAQRALEDRLALIAREYPKPVEPASEEVSGARKAWLKRTLREAGEGTLK